MRRSLFEYVQPTQEERDRTAIGDHLIPAADVVMDRGFTVPAPPEEVWPWLVQLGKGRAGWYLPATIERLIPRSRRATRRIEERWQRLEVGDVIPDYGGRNAVFEAVVVQAPGALVYASVRGPMNLTWAITLTGSTVTRLHLRLRLAPVRHRWLARSGGELLDMLTIAGMAAGLTERVVRSDREG